jgi:hypothetical protein
MLASNLVDHGFEPQTGQTKDYTIGMCCFSTIILEKFVFKWFSNSLEEDLKNVSINQIVTVNYFLEFREILLIRVPSNHLCTDWV